MFTLRRIVTARPTTLARPTFLPTMAQKRPFNEGKRHFKKSKKQKTSTLAEGSNEEVLLADIRSLLKNVKISSHDAAAEEEQAKILPEMHAEIDVTINELSSTGDGLAEKDGQVYVVPFSAPGDLVTARVYKHFDDESYSLADFVKVVQPGKLRTQDPKCPYFTQCSGCQFQHMSYDDQLAHKRTIVEKAYRNFSKLPASAVPKIGDTIGSPLHYGYRTKLTPHFDGPPGGRRDKRHGKQVTWPEVPPIGFMKKGTRKTMDIEDCPIGTDTVRLGMKRERKRVAGNIDQYQKGATLLLRENTERLEKQAGMVEEDKDTEPKDEVLEDRGSYVHRKTCITDHKQTSTEYVDDYRLDNPAGAFFQNNNSILPVVTQYIRDHILDPAANENPDGKPQIKNMIDAYCGSGFFTITLSKMFHNSIGIDISAQSIDFASKNAKLNSLPEDGTHFIAADANALFASVDTKKFPPAETVVVIDPPRKGCDEGFIRQLLEYGPARVCYVSCNVHTQARDVGWLVSGLPGSGGKEGLEGLYEIETLRGFDFFPQTSHVEGVATLRKKLAASKTEEHASNGVAPAVEKETD
ncbi:tRNA (uracil(54)-C(5))-methyltransferase [Fulvia fulva]|uniref:tRNA (Uracil(54)-C(5))-methyltransferase n=1 Tax=Passalora fulva TaxID=5499 RepID=A0A9Q8PEA7_PASFU|nr:tRNA (uracil(54)-C(5))-methyltransferase [Fulvia fulva]KAK4619119.1 tRNA (uracil(54)-C(5))-methyltransferase [Fulvia fulva]UJO20898.1 tRNA (uracil(54)-C(5))-methyltransferase [Fulvia fulva]WPV32950.1 tRNA (uracil(54)-C(5))-methyltransferase [Fulvia fulva]